MMEVDKAYERILKKWCAEGIVTISKFHTDAEYHALIVRLARSAAQLLVEETHRAIDDTRIGDIRKQRVGRLY